MTSKCPDDGDARDATCAFDDACPRIIDCRKFAMPLLTDPHFYTPTLSSLLSAGDDD